MSLTRRALLGSSLAVPLVATPPWTRRSHAASGPVDLELVLAVDVSRSVDAEEFDLQRRGYAQALVAPSVLRAIHTGEHGRIGIIYVEWSGGSEQMTVVDWAAISDDESAGIFSEKILRAARPFAGYTSISGALLHSMRAFADSPFVSQRRVIDVSGDGSNNSGGPLAPARDRVLAAGITINGLPILNGRPSPYGRVEHKLDEYYQDQVIGGDGSFMIPADDFDSFGAAVLSKLIKEIA